MRFLERHGVPLYYVPAGGPVNAGHMRSHEPAVLSLVHRSDFLVLARYMQVLSGKFLSEYGRDVINIHVRVCRLCAPAHCSPRTHAHVRAPCMQHGLLPSFKGANPYRQAYQAGVKVRDACMCVCTASVLALHPTRPSLRMTL
jgi:formyltetrahydrofolate deformylase